MKKRLLDLSELSVTQLRGIKAVLTNGAIASADAKSTARKLKAENEELKQEKATLQSRWQKIADAGLTGVFSHTDEEDKYIIGFSDEHFETMLTNLARAIRETASAETNTLRIPPVFGGVEELSSFDYLRQSLRNRRNGEGS